MGFPTLPANHTSASPQSHLEFLHEVVFKTDSKWPHCARLLDDIEDIVTQVQPHQTVVCLERTFLYGSKSLYAPFFQHAQQFISVDCLIETTEERGFYQAHWLEDPRCIHIPSDLQAPITETTLPDACADILLIPNVIHHVREQEAMFAEFARLLKPGGVGYLFETPMRELHQIPNDYIRYTPWGVEAMLARQGMKMTRWIPSGGPFEAIAYCWTQALEYLPEEQRKEREAWFYETQFPELLALDRQYPENQCRPYTAFPLAFGLYFEKP